ncbi:MAG: flavodoxin [Clostridiales bacterium]|nr:flavodoxin [Clostridiales bacterium]
MKTLIAYFSAQGTTARLAKALAELIGADLFEIRPEVPYTAADIRWTNPLARCNREKLGRKDVPFIGSVENWDEYDAVCVGFPIWYYGAPNIVNTFCGAYDWSGKKVAVFATSGGSDIGKTVTKLTPYLKGGPEIVSAGVYRSAEEAKQAIGPFAGE